MFHLRDSLASAEFSGRLDNVFASIGSGQVAKADKEQDEDKKDAKPDFDRLQMERSGSCRTEPGRTSRGTVEPEFKKPKIDTLKRKSGGRGRVPDFRKNPEKYTKYSLEDVPNVTNSSNSAAAFDFLNKLKTPEEAEVPADLSKKMVFKKRVKKSEEDKVVTMEEGEVKKPTKSQTKTKTSRPLLSFDNDDEEDE